MNGDRMEFSQEKMREILKTEFLVPEEALEGMDAKWAEMSIEVYESLEAFLESTGWERDNPECGSEAYLTGNRICRWVDGKLLYFSRLVFEDKKVGDGG